MKLDHHFLLPAICSLIAEELSELRGTGLLELDSARWDGQTVIGGDALPADSIEIVSLATNCAERFGLEEIGAGDHLLRYRRLADWAELAATGMREAGAVTFRTSGTTGQPKRVKHRLEDLEQEVLTLGRLLPDADRIVSLVPSHHIYGFLFTVLLPMHLNVPVSRQGSASGLLPGDLRAGDWLIGFPLRWRQMKRLGRPLPKGVSAVTSTSPCPPELIRDMAALGMDRMLSIYGSTETAGIGFRFGTDASYKLFDYWSRDGNALRRTRPGIGEAISIEPQDTLEFSDERHFRPIGRKDSVVQVAGRNVHPAHVASRLAAHPLVARCSVHLDDSLEEPRLCASIVLSAGADERNAESSLRAWVRDELVSAERPARWSFLHELPTTMTGKPRGWEANA
ncbi:MAG: AMP-binding protein [Ectothiorhodospiraceae bacterium]|nr:AMP-binding protein [Ectothiorhodospiraceae bacterium]